MLICVQWKCKISTKEPKKPWFHKIKELKISYIEKQDHGKEDLVTKDKATSKAPKMNHSLKELEEYKEAEFLPVDNVDQDKKETNESEGKM